MASITLGGIGAPVNRGFWARLMSAANVGCVVMQNSAISARVLLRARLVCFFMERSMRVGRVSHSQRVVKKDFLQGHLGVRIAAIATCGNPVVNPLRAAPHDRFVMGGQSE